MTQEDKQLLFQDLSARLPYGVIVEIISYGQENLKPWVGKLYCKDLDCFIHDIAYKSVKPYLRPMSSMTYEEKTEFKEIRNSVEAKFINAINGDGFTLAYYELIDWLNKHHFDYRGLIFRGLALEAKEGMYDDSFT